MRWTKVVWAGVFVLASTACNAHHTHYEPGVIPGTDAFSAPKHADAGCGADAAGDAAESDAGDADIGDAAESDAGDAAESDAGDATDRAAEPADGDAVDTF